MGRFFQGKGKVFIRCGVVLCMVLIFVFFCMGLDKIGESSSNHSAQGTEAGMKNEAGTDTESGIETEVESGTVINTEMESGTVINTEAESGTVINTEMELGAMINTEADSEIALNTETETEVNSDTSADTETNQHQQPEQKPQPETPIKNEKKTIGNLLRTALQPVGSTMYVWGGGWNEEDTGAGIEAVTIGLSPRWAEFAAQQDASYNFQNTRYQIHDGLDCSGFIGWSIYNVMETENGKEGYVMKATTMALNFAAKGWGTYTEAGKVTDWKAGDIMSMAGHVWMVIGSCSDGSVVLMHASPPGVSIAGTVLEDGSNSEAVRLAEKYMSTYYPGWYERYPDCSKGYSYIRTSASMSWNRQTLADEEGLTEMTAEEVLKWMFSQE